MTSPTHVVIGITASLCLAKANDLPFRALDLIFVMIGSLLPDLDADGGAIARPGRILRNFLPKGVANFIDGIVTTLAKIINSILGHRGPLHWPIIGVVMYILGLAYGKTWLMWIGWGYLWHILADFCTTQGVPLLGPFRTRFISWSRMRTGSPYEAIIFSVALLSMCFLGWSYLPEQTRFWLNKYYNFVF